MNPETAPLVDRLVAATRWALEQVTDNRFYKSERGYQGQFYCKLQERLMTLEIVNGTMILEMEYQKTDAVHGTTQRPDIILHEPRENSGGVRNNNLAVWAFKLKASVTEAQEDFRKLDQMLGGLDYHIGFFINVGSIRLHSYTGSHHIAAFAVRLSNGKVSITSSESLGH